MRGPACGRREDAIWEAESVTRRNIAMVATVPAVVIFASLKKKMVRLSSQAGTLFFLFPVL